jgi:hypothetical protein
MVPAQRESNSRPSHYEPKRTCPSLRHGCYSAASHRNVSEVTHESSKTAAQAANENHAGDDAATGLGAGVPEHGTTGIWRGALRYSRCSLPVRSRPKSGACSSKNRNAHVSQTGDQVVAGAAQSLVKRNRSKRGIRSSAGAAPCAGHADSYHLRRR